jgi:hypothetical protein
MLLGAAVGAVAAALYLAACWVSVALDPLTSTPRESTLDPLLGSSASLAVVADNLGVAIGLALLFAVPLLLLRGPLRNVWLGRVLFLLFWIVGLTTLTLVFASYGTGWSLLMPLVATPVFAVVFVLLSRSGLLTLAAACFAFLTLLTHPLTLDTSAWYAPQGWMGVAAIGALVGWSLFATTRRARRARGGDLAGGPIAVDRLS